MDQSALHICYFFHLKSNICEEMQKKSFLKISSGFFLIGIILDFLYNLIANGSCCFTEYSCQLQIDRFGFYFLEYESWTPE